MSVKLGSICKFQSGGTPAKEKPEYFNGNIPWITTTALNGSTIDETDAVDWITEKAINETAAKIVPAYSIMVGTRVGVGKVALNTVDMSTSQDIISLINIDENKWSKDYLCKFLQGKSSFLISQARGATIKGIKIDVLSNLELPKIGYKQQQYISEIIDKVSVVIKHRRQELQQLDDLIKARFVEMFGDPEIGTCIYPTERLRDLSIKISDGVHAKPEYTETGRPFLSVVNINKGIIDFTDCKFVSEEAFQKMIKSTYPQRGDVLYTKVGATYGIPAYVNTDREFCLYVSVCLIKPKHEVINSRFLALQMGMPSIKHQADARIKGIGVPDLHLNQISEFRIVCPPRELQDEFVSFVEHVDKSKATVQKALTEAQLFFNSMMQKHFG